MFLPVEEVEKQSQQVPLSRQQSIQKCPNKFKVKESVVPTKEPDLRGSAPCAISPDMRAIRKKSLPEHICSVCKQPDCPVKLVWMACCRSTHSVGKPPDGWVWKIEDKDGLAAVTAWL